jgi:hypothetical protein
MLRTIVSTLLVAGFVTACADDSVPTVDTNVDKGQPVADLDEPTEAELCEDLADFAQDFYNEGFYTKLSCISVAALSGVDYETGQLDEGACQRAYDECLNNPPEPEEPGDPGEYSCDLAEIPAECADVTVGDLVDCTEEAAAFLDEYITNFSCSKLDEASAQTEVGPACTRLEEKCPGLYGGEDTTDPPPG